MLVITTDLRTDGGTQPRGRLDDDVVERYAADMGAGLWDFSKSSEPITAFHDGENYWLGNGFHRVAAAKKARLDELEVDVRQGGQRDAILYSVGANAHHGLQRSSEDKRRAVARLLEDPEWSKWSDREVARRCFVAPTFVSKLRSSLSTVDSEKRTYTTKHGTIATMTTSRIGRSPQRAIQRANESADGLAKMASGEAETEIALSGTAQEKLDAAIRAHKRKLELEFETRVRAECLKWREEHSIPAYLEKLDRVERMFTWPRNAVMKHTEYKTILMCLHPDGLKARTEQQMAEAFRIFTNYKPKMVSSEPDWKPRGDFPRTREELLARKKKR